MRIIFDERPVDLDADGPVIGAMILAAGGLDNTYELYKDPDGPRGVLGEKIGSLETVEVRPGDRFVATPRCCGLSLDD